MVVWVVVVVVMVVVVVVVAVVVVVVFDVSDLILRMFSIIRGNRSYSFSRNPLFSVNSEKSSGFPNQCFFFLYIIIIIMLLHFMS